MKSFMTIEGAGAHKTIVQWGGLAQIVGAKGQAIGTFGSATFAVNAPYFIAKNITFQVIKTHALDTFAINSHF